MSCLPETPAQVSDLADSLVGVFNIDEDYWQRGRLSKSIKSHIDTRAKMFVTGLSRDLRRVIREEEIVPQFIGRVSYVVGELQYDEDAKTRLTTNLKLIPTKDGTRVDVSISHKADTSHGRFGFCESPSVDGSNMKRFEGVLGQMAQAVA